jgi:hypothetical protein
MDNRVFDVNGEGLDMLIIALKLAFMQLQAGDRTTAQAWSMDPKYGLILHWYPDAQSTRFLIPASPEEAANMVFKWLLQDDLPVFPDKDDWDGDCDHDGHNEEGWRVYCGAWGHVGGNRSAICAIKPTMLWYGK